MGYLSKLMFYALLALFCGSNHLQGIQSTPVPPLTEPLQANVANKSIPQEWLVNASLPSLYNSDFSLEWVDNDRLVFSFNGNIELYDITKHTRTTLGKGIIPKPSPNGQWIAFIEAKDNINQIWVMRTNGSEKKQLTNLNNGLLGEYGYHYNFTWSSGSNHLALYINPECYPSIVRDSSLEVPPSSIHLIDVMKGTAQKIYSNVALIDSISWYPDNSKLLISVLHINFKEKHMSFIKSISVNDGYECILAKLNGLQQSLYPRTSPDGRQVSLLYTAENELFDWMNSIGIVDGNPAVNVDTPSIKQLTFDLKLAGAKWSKDGRCIFAVRNYGAYHQIYSIDIQTGIVKQITNAPLDISKFEISPDGSKLAWKGIDAHGSQIIRMSSIDGNHIQDLITYKGYSEEVALGEVREIEWETIDYPSKMRGLLFLPLNYQEGIRYPLIVDIHGGGSGASIMLAGGIFNESPLEWQLWTAKGYAVFVPEFRSSAAFGFLAISRDELKEHNIINCDITDVIAGVDELVKSGIADINRMAVIGHSAGARRVNWLTVSRNKFRVAISKEGWADEWELGMNFPTLHEGFGGSPLEVPENYLKNSALHHSKGASTPTLFLMGNPNLGGVDLYNKIPKLHQDIKEQGVETEYVYYPDEGHNFVLPKNRQDALERIMKWVDDHIAPKQ